MWQTVKILYFLLVGVRIGTPQITMTANIAFKKTTTSSPDFGGFFKPTYATDGVNAISCTGYAENGKKFYAENGAWGMARVPILFEIDFGQLRNVRSLYISGDCRGDPVNLLNLSDRMTITVVNGDVSQ